MVDDATDTEQTILDATREEVLAHGIRRTSVSDIARRSGVARQTLYRYWPDGKALFAALITRELLALLPVGAPEAKTLDDLVGMLVRTAAGIRSMPILGRLRETDPELFSRYILERLGTSQRAIHHEIERRIGAGQASGIVRTGPPAAMAAMVLLTAQSAVQSAPLVAEWLDDDEWASELAHALRGHLAPVAT